MIEPSLRTLPTPSSDRGSTSFRPHCDPRHPLTLQDSGYQDSHQKKEPAGDCLVILPAFSSSAFNSESGTGPTKCQCKSFFLSPGDPDSCLCGHPASCHSADPLPSGSPNISTTPPSPSIPVRTTISRNLLLEDGERILARITKLEQMLAHEIHVRNVLQANHRILQINHQRLADHCRLLEDGIGIIAGKMDGLETLKGKTEKLVAATELLDQLDARVEDLEFRSDDLENWVDEEEKRQIFGDDVSECDGASSASSTPTLCASSVTTTLASTPALSPKFIVLPPPSQVLSSKRRRSNSDAAVTTSKYVQTLLPKRARTIPSS